jgi:hypothetical protein
MQYRRSPSRGAAQAARLASGWGVRVAPPLRHLRRATSYVLRSRPRAQLNRRWRSDIAWLTSEENDSRRSQDADNHNTDNPRPRRHFHDLRALPRAPIAKAPLRREMYQTAETRKRPLSSDAHQRSNDCDCFLEALKLVNDVAPPEEKDGAGEVHPGVEKNGQAQTSTALCGPTKRQPDQK